MSAYTHTLLATLGGQPQVVTFTLDLLLRRGLPISEVIVLHPEASDPRLQHSLACLNAEFVGDQYQFNGSTIHLRSQVLRLDDDTLLEDIVDDMSATGALDTIQPLSSISSTTWTTSGISILPKRSNSKSGMANSCIYLL